MLAKFKSEEIIDSLQKGCVYMNTLTTFRRIERDSDDDKVGDWLDGLMHIHKGFLIVDEPNSVIQILENEGLRTKFSDDYCYCFFGMNETNYHKEFTDEQKQKFREMGEYALLILNYEEFLRRFLNAISDKGYEVYDGFVNYYDPGIDSFNVRQLLGTEGLKMIPLLKRKKYSYQQEYRIVIHAPNENKDHLEIEIGDISDISKKIKAETLLKSKIVPASNSIKGGGN